MFLTSGIPVKNFFDKKKVAISDNLFLTLL